MPAAFLASRIDPVYRRREIAEWLDTDFDPSTETLLVAEEGGPIAGFVHVALGDKGEVGATGHVNLLYVDPPRQGQGVGRSLMGAGARWLMQRQPGPLALSAYERNPFRPAYASMGGVETKRLRFLIEGTEIETVIYRWHDPTTLCG